MNHSQLTKKEKAGQLFSPAAFIHDTEEHYQNMEVLVREHGIGGITFFHSRASSAANFEKRQETLDYSDSLDKLVYLINRYQKQAKIPLLFSIDAEYGLAMRVEKTPQYPYAISLGALDLKDRDLVYEVGYRMGQDLKAAGIHLNFAPVADINTQPENPVIGYRSFGKEREKVTQFALAMYQGLEAAGVKACYKHFPGHGDTIVDSHLGLPIIDKTKTELMDEELYPFIEGIRAGVDMIMVGHLAAPALTLGQNIPASLSTAIIKDLLRGELGFKGLVVSDALNMKSVSPMHALPGQLEWEAFKAGNDLLCFSEEVEAGIAYIAREAKGNNLDTSVEKVLELKNKLGLFDAKTEVQTPQYDKGSIRTFNAQLAERYLNFEKKGSIGKKIRAMLSQGQILKTTAQGPADHPFFQKLDAAFPPKNLSWHEIMADKSQEPLLAALFVPSVKPVNDFGLDLKRVEALTDLARKRPIVLVLFGNPLALRKFSDVSLFDTILVAYQSFEEVQEVAAEKLLSQV
ncbi:glycoside hydrolase family 3 protein [Pararhodonellum marinum]|uniref:glycoside hydrolase family 3 protein n=1 Tax=Pararhodonellum marinum TaxID=2755358 RepID=UPI001E4724A6|nr:glycoside hydrolase family 3 protein [Pararhodonellum marinum]